MLDAILGVENEPFIILQEKCFRLGIFNSAWKNVNKILTGLSQCSLI
jgi:hypothetical protein